MNIRYSSVLALAFLLFASLVEAKTYQIPPPGNSGKEALPGCDYDRNTNTFQCNSGLSLRNDDVIKLRNNASLPISINVEGDVVLGARVSINQGGNAQDIQFTVNGDFTVGDASFVAATIITANEVTINSKTKELGDISADEINIGDESVVNGNIDSVLGVDIGNRATINGKVSTEGEISIKNGVSIIADLLSAGKVQIGNDFDLGGGIRSDSSIELGNRTVVTGEINNSGDFEAGENTEFGANINSSGEVSLGNRAQVDGSVDADGDVSLGHEGHISGNINSRGDVKLEVRSTVEGYVNAKNGGDDGDLGEGTVIGLTCNRNNNRGPCDGEPPGAPLGELGYWTFDEPQWQGSSGEVADSSGNGLNGVALRGASTEGVEPAIAGSPGTCRYGVFDGSNAVRVNSAASIANAESVSVAFWFKGEAQQQERWERYQTLLMVGDGPTESSGGRFEVYRQDRFDGGGINFEIRNNNGNVFKVEAGNTLRGQDNLLDNTWHHLAASYDKGARRLRLYIDGQLVDETSFNRTHTLNPVSDNLYIGGQATGDYSFNGAIDEVFIGNKPLTSSEVATLRERTRPCGGERPLCEAVWPERGTSDNSVPIPFSLPTSHWENQLPENLDPIDYLRTGDFEDVGENYSTNGPTSRVYIDGDLTIQSGRRININGDANELILVVTGDLYLERDVKINGYIYVAGDFSYDSSIFFQTEVTGSISVGGRVQGNDWWDWWSAFGPDITYQRPTEPIDGGNFCRATDSEPPVFSVHHYQLSYNSPALTCTGADVGIKACTNSDCSEAYPAGATVELSSLAGEWSSNPVTVSPLGSSTLKQLNAGTYALAIDNGGTSPQPQSSARCIVNGSLSEDCNIEFRDTGFIFTNGDNRNDTDIPRQISAEPYNNLKLWAVETNSQTLACEAILEPMSSVSMSMNCVDPDECLMGTTVNGSNVVENTFNDVDINFNNGKADLRVNYADAGAIALTARAELPNGEIQGTSEAFVWAPASIRVEATENSPGSYQNNILAKAGEVFTAQLTALNSQGDVTPNFGNEIVPDSLQLKSETRATSPAVRDGVLSNANGFINAGNGTFRNEGLSYSEVGSTRVTAYIESEAYLSEYHLTECDPSECELEVSSELTEIGRFIPYEFEPLTAEFIGNCTDFYYMGQPQPVALSARALNASGDITKNYTGSLAKATPMFYAYDSTGTELPGHSVSHDGSWEWSEGIGQFTGNASVTVSRLNSGERDGPFEDYVLGWQLDDQEDDNFYSVIENGGLPLPTSFEATELDTASLYYGRINLQDTYAAMNDVMPVEGAVEYWDGTNFAINRKDNCETFSNDALNYVAESSAGPDPIKLNIPLPVTLERGEISPVSKDLPDLLRWESESSDTPYTFTFELNVPDYLKYDWPYNDDESDDGSDYTDNPRAEGTFGIYRGSDRQIYWQEVGW